MSHDSIRIAVHNGTFHTDDVFAMAITSQWAHKKGYDATMIRSREQSVLDDSQIVLDVGGVFDPEKHRYDHHQSGYDQVRSNGIPYASAGLAWRAYGMELCGGNARVHELVDRQLIQPIDAGDCGIDLVTSTHVSGAFPFDINSITVIARPTWKEERAEAGVMNQCFWAYHESAKKILNRSIIHAQDDAEGERIVEHAYFTAADKRIVICDWEYPWMDVLCKFPEPLFFVYKRSDGSWGSKVVRTHGSTSFESRILFPTAWSGLRADELRSATGVADANFAHPGRFLVGAETQEGVLTLINLAIEQHNI